MPDASLTPEYLVEIQFTTAMRGYQQDVVDAFLDAVIANLKTGRPALADLTPGFPIVMRGYAVSEVNALLESLSDGPIRRGMPPENPVVVVKPKSFLSRLFG